MNARKWMAKLVHKGIACFGKSSKGKNPGELVALSKKEDVMRTRRYVVF